MLSEPGWHELNGIPDPFDETGCLYWKMRTATVRCISDVDTVRTNVDQLMWLYEQLQRGTSDNEKSREVEYRTILRDKLPVKTDTVDHRYLILGLSHAAGSHPPLNPLTSFS